MTTVRFEDLFGAPPEVISWAPGRVNLIGEHTDYNGGLVMPSAIPQRATVSLRRRADDVVNAVSAQFGRGSYRIGQELRTGGWIDYVQGMTRALAGAGMLSGFDLLVDSSVPAGSGLASSAAIEIAVGRALRDTFSVAMTDVDLARAGQRAEHDVVGAPVGIMDQMAASFADTRTALYLDTRSLLYRRLPLPADAALVVIHSGIAHHHASGAYSARRLECREAAGRLGVGELRDLDLVDLDRIAALPSPLDQRARHVVTENARVIEAVHAIGAGDLPRLGAILTAGHASLRDDYEVSVPAIDTLVDIALVADGVFGARLTGGGFGGSAVILVHHDCAREVAPSIAARYAERTGHSPIVVMPIEEDAR